MNGNDILAQGILQAGQAIGAGLQQRAQTKAMLNQQQYENMISKMQMLYNIAGNKDLDDNVRQFALNAATGMTKSVFPNMENMPSIDISTPQGKSTGNYIGTLTSQWAQGKISQPDYLKTLSLLSAITAQTAPTQAGRERAQKEAFQFAGQVPTALRADIEQQRFQQEQMYGVGAPTEVMIGGKTQYGRFTPTGKFVQFQPTIPVAERPQVPPKAIAGEAAGRLTGAQSAINDIQQARNIIFPKGTFDPIKVFTGKLQIPKSQGREARIRIRRALETKLRADTGATARQEEVDELMKAFAPALGDTSDFAMDKLNRLEQIMTQFIFVQDPTGKFNLQPITGQSQQIIPSPIPTPTPAPTSIKIKSFKRMK